MVSWLLSLALFTAIAGQNDCTIVYFGSANCAPCEQMTPVLSQLKQEGWDIRAVDATQNAKMAQLYRIQNLPTLVIVSSNKEVDRIVGAVSYEQLSSRFERAAARTQSASNPLASPANATTPIQMQPSSSGPGNSQGLIVRGQSQASSGFPMLSDSLSDFGSNQSNAAAAQVTTAEYEAPTQNQPMASLQPQANQLQPRQLQSTQPQAAQPQSNQVQPAESFGRPTLTIDQAIARAAAATVRIKVEEANTTAYGTGTIIDVHGSEALILTCGHLFRDMKPGSQLSVDLFAGTQNEMSVFAQLIDFKAEEEDIGLLSFQLPVAIEPVEILPRSERLQIGQPAFSFGCDHGDDPTRRDTQIRNVNRYIGAANVEIVGAPAVGRSGGGLFDTQGRLIGVCNAADAQDDEGIYAAAEVVYTQIERLGLSHLFEGLRPAPVQLASNATLQNAPINNSWGSNASVQPASFGQPSVLAQPANPPLSGDPSSLHRNQSEASFAGAQEIICIVRNNEGQSRIVTIPGPSSELLQAIEQNAQN